MNDRTRGRARIGVVVPLSNTNLEPDLTMLCLPGVSLHFARAGGYDLDAIPDEHQRTKKMTETVELAESMAASATEETASRAAFGALLGDLLPRQGCWSDEGYSWLTDHSRRPVEFTDGVVEELPMPTDTHQAILGFLNDLFRVWLRPRGGVVRFSGLRLRIREGKFREPDLPLLRDRSDPRRQDRYWLGADLVNDRLSQGRCPGFHRPRSAS